MVILGSAQLMMKNSTRMHPPMIKSDEQERNRYLERFENVTILRHRLIYSAASGELLSIRLLNGIAESAAIACNIHYSVMYIRAVRPIS
jgi:hypothetical protein